MEDLPLTVTENDDGSFTFDWDDQHPVASQFNTWTKEDFHNAIRMGLEEFKLEKEEMKWRTEFTVEEFQRHFDDLFERVENGETFVIVRPDGKNVYILPMQQ